MANVPIEPVRTIDETVRRWVEEIDLSREREKDWRKDGFEAEEMYDCVKQSEADSFNILHSNTETLAPSLYGSVPTPVVQRRFKDNDPLGKSVSAAGQRVLEFLMDTNSEEYDTFDESIKDCVQDGLLPGRGITEFCYHAETEDYGEGDTAGSTVTAEGIYPKSVVWNRFYHGYAKRWCDVPWCAIELYLDKDAVAKEFSKEIADAMVYSISGDANKDKKGDEEKNEPKTKIKTACIYKIWDKKKKEIVWVSPNHPTSILRTDEDELKLTGFYPFPKPLRFHRKSNNLLPTTMYRLYRTQAKELNTISLRLIHLLKACKIRGIYDSQIGEIEDLLKSEENDLIPAENVAALQNTKGLEGAIWLMPIEKIIMVVKELYLAREQCKKVIYEITGISDIIRGSTQASETLGAQKIKEQWVTLRLKNMQKEVQRYVRESLRIMLEIAGNRFQEDTWVKMTGLPFTTSEEYAQAKQIADAAIAQAQQQPMPVPGMPSQPAAPPQIPPEVQQKLQAPQWSQVLGAMKDNLTRQYKIDIETNSTLDVEATQDKEQIAEVMNAIAQFLSGVAPLIQDGVMPFQAAQGMLLAIVRKFRFGVEIEDYIKTMQEPKPKPDPAAEAKQAMEQQKLQAQQNKDGHDARMAQLDQQHQREEAQRSDQREQAKLAAEMQGKQMELAAQRQQHQDEMRANKELELAKLSAQRATEEMKARVNQETTLKEATLQAAVAIETAKISAESSERTATQKAAVDKDKNDKQAAVQADANKKQADSQAATTKNEGKATEMMGGMMDKILETQQQLIELIGSDKEITRDEKGRAKGMKVVKK